jgi:hypothetical protein
VGNYILLCVIDAIYYNNFENYLIKHNPRILSTIYPHDMPIGGEGNIYMSDAENYNYYGLIAFFYTIIDIF